MRQINFSLPVGASLESVSDGRGNDLPDVIQNNQIVNLGRVLPVVYPEDFSGNTIAEKVIAANAFILNAGGGFELNFSKSSSYLITEAIVLPSNTTVKMDGCTIQLADNTVDNIFRTANIIIDPANPRGYALNRSHIEPVHNIKIVGVNSPKLVMVENATTYGEPNTGWRGHTVEFVGVSNFEISGFKIEKNIAWSICINGCCYGSVHDIEFATTRNNGDGVDIEFGTHDVEVYNLSGYCSDDIVAIANSGPSRLEQRPIEIKHPTAPYNYDWRRFGLETYNIRVYNVHAATNGGGGIVDFVCGDYGIHHISISNISDKDRDTISTTGTAVLVLDGSYDGGYYNGLIHDVSINDIECNYGNGGSGAIRLVGIIKNCKVNNIKVASGVNVLNNQSGETPSDWNFEITNTGTL